MSALLGRVGLYGRMIRFSHSVFALPFALSSAILAAGAGISWRQVAWILVAMVGARSAAMGFNRLADQALDARNPRTAGRELPRGAISRAEVWVFVAASAATLVVAAAMLNPLCLALSPVGLALAVAPVGAWLAIRGRIEPAPVVLGLAVLFWVAGFDTIYACQDEAFDRAEGLHSLPARLGVGRALVFARLFHVIALALLAAVYTLAPLHPVYLAGVAAIAALLVYEHSLVRADDLSRIDAAFFAVNGWISLGYFVVTLAARLLA